MQLMTSMLGLEERTLLSDREARMSAFGNLTGLLQIRSLTSVLDILREVEYSNLSYLGEKLQSLRGRRFDFIGGGISGVTSAYFTGELSRLFDLGWEVHLWDRLDGVGLKTTKDSAARIRTSMFGTPGEVSGNLATSIFFENLPGLLARGAVEKRVEFSPDDVHTGLSRCGYLWLFEDFSSREHVATSKRLLDQLGVPTYFLQPDEVASVLMPGINQDRFDFAYFCPTDAYVEPTSIVSSLHRYNRKVLGVVSHFNEEAVEVDLRAGEPIRFRTRNLSTGAETTHKTNYLGLTTGACSKEIGKRFVLDGTKTDLAIPVIPKPRQLTYAVLQGDANLEEHEPFNILMGNGAYWTRETPRSKSLIFGFAWEGDHEVDPRHVFAETIATDKYFIDNMLQGDGRLDGIHRDISLGNEGLRIVRSKGNLYGETIDGKYLVGLVDAANNVRPSGRVGIVSGDNGHGIMSSLGNAVQLVFRLTEIVTEEYQLYNPNRSMDGDRGDTKRL